MEAKTYTLFCMDGYWPAGKGNVPADLFGAIEYAVSEDAEYPPVAWAAESVIAHGGTKGFAELRDESIAAGRVIEFRDGKYIPLGVAEEAPKQVTWAECMAEVVAHVAKQAEPQRPALDWNAPKPFDAFKGFFTEPADIADWQDTYFPR